MKYHGPSPRSFFLFASYIVLVLCYFFTSFYRISAAVVMPVLAAETGISAAVTGFIASLFFYAYAAAQPIGGMLNDRFGPGRIVTGGIALAAAGALCFAFGTSPWIFAVGRFLMGLGLGPMLSGALVFVGKTRLALRYTFYTGLILTVGNFGAVVSVYPLGAALEAFNRRTVFIVLAVVNGLLALALKASVRRSGADLTPRHHRSAGEGFKRAFVHIARSRNLRLIMLPWFVQMGAILSLQGLWAVVWFQSVYELPFIEAQGYASMISIGVMIGHFIGGYIGSDRTHRRRMIVSSAFISSTLWLLFWGVMLLRLPAGISAAAGLLVGVSVGVSFDHLVSGVHDMAPPGEGGSVFGAANFFPFIGALLYQWLTGLVLARFPGATGGFTPEGFLFTFILVIVTLFASSLLLIRLRPIGPADQGEG